jgi:hypothetical protein
VQDATSDTEAVNLCLGLIGMGAAGSSAEFDDLQVSFR